VKLFRTPKEVKEWRRREKSKLEVLNRAFAGQPYADNKKLRLLAFFQQFLSW